MVPMQAHIPLLCVIKCKRAPSRHYSKHSMFDNVCLILTKLSQLEKTYVKILTQYAAAAAGHRLN